MSHIKEPPRPLNVGPHYPLVDTVIGEAAIPMRILLKVSVSPARMRVAFFISELRLELSSVFPHCQFPPPTFCA